MSSHARVLPEPGENGRPDARRKRRRISSRAWGRTADRRSAATEAELFWDWLALRQSFLSGASVLAEQHWLEDPLARRPVAAALRRAFDVVAASLLLAVLSPVILACMALVRLTSRGPVIFRQRRIGHQCRRFEMLKLRTMVDGAHRMEDALARAGGGTFLKLVADPRTTPLGRFLRKYSLDELPQLVNVLRGEMSLVGPRPLLLSDFDKFPKAEQMRRFSVPPGITGLWQVSGRSATTDEQRIRLDLEYVARQSPWLDLKILLRTIPVALGAKGAY